MERYRDRNRDSGVLAYEFGEDYIIVQFKDRAKYLYTYRSAGSTNIERMKILAQNGNGLNSYINVYVRDRYEKRLR